VVVIIPTYNEAENIETAVTSIREVSRAFHILIVDDSSPDGTGELADQIASTDAEISVLHHGVRAGLGAAYLAGFEWALSRNFEVLIEMDADGSHPAETLNALIDRLDSPTHADVVIGSRWVPGGGLVDWPITRRILSRSGNLYAQLALRMAVKDSTGGFRAYRAEVLRQIRLDDVESRGYCFQIDMTRRVLTRGFAIEEVPIIFSERTHGVSKMNSRIVLEAMLRVTQWGLASLFSPRPQG
jgi:dolichol-phosphate mannosyltransferase